MGDKKPAAERKWVHVDQIAVELQDIHTRLCEMRLGRAAKAVNDAMNTMGWEAAEWNAKVKS